MKKEMIMVFALSLLIIPLISAAPCEISVSMINQDPYPAIPGDYVKVVFQVDGIANTECGIVKFGLKENYPISLDPNATNEITVNSGTFQRSYSSFYLAPYKLRIDENAIEGDNPIEFYYTYKNGPEILKEFEIYVEDTRADFEVYIKNYDSLTRTLTFEILNIEKVDIEALTVDIPSQEGIQIKGANRKVVGDLDSNEYTTADFEAIIEGDEANLSLNLIYTDSINVRRQITKQVKYDSSYFTNRSNGTQKKQPIWLYVIIVVVVAWLIYRKIRKNQLKKKRMMKHHSH